MGLLDNPETLNQLGMALGLLNAKKGDNWPGLLSQEAVRMQAMQTSKQREEERKQQARLLQMQIAQQERAMADQDRQRSVMGGMPDFTRPAPLPDMAPTPENAAALANQPKPKPHEVMFKQAEYYASKGMPDQADKLYERGMKMMPQVQEVRQGKDINGSLVDILVFKDGSTSKAPFGSVEKLMEVNRGGTVDLVGEKSGKPTASLTKTQTPDSAASLAQSERHFNMNFSKPQMLEGTNGPLWATPPRNQAPGIATPVMQYGGDTGAVPVGPKMPESQRKELRDLDSQLNVLDRAIADVKATPTAFGFMRGSATKAGSVAETLASRNDQPKEREVRAFVYNVVSKAINERAGAAQTPMEMTRLRSFLPDEQDNHEQIIDKLTGYRSYVQELRKGQAGTGMPQASGGRVIDFNSLPK